MKRMALAAAFVLSATAAGAADLPAPQAPVLAAPFSWTGAYVGVHGGYGWTDTDWRLLDNAGPGACGECGTIVTGFGADGFLAGLQGGYNWQLANGVVIGVEADLSFTWADGEGRWNAATRTAALDLDFLATLGPRIGYGADRLLVYIEGGLALARGEYEHRNLTNGARFTSDETRTGWFVGGGVEYAFAQNWSAKIEYNYVSFGDESVNLAGNRGGGQPGVAVFDVEQDMQIVKAGLNYRF
ncbi:outer membrane protein [Salinarimonas sp. NSM]|uniref:outer membrane protein n=1 Tax=Salinarimonas sp. NSM TaxID=3458003 RepID=UPI0040356E75